MGNPFEDQFVTIRDSPEQRVLLECKVCGIIETLAVYDRKSQILAWKCPDEHYNEVEVELNV